MNHNETFSSIFNAHQPQQNTEWKGFNQLLNKMIFEFRSLGFMCDLVQQQNIQNGKAVKLMLSKDGIYKEFYEVGYSGNDIYGRCIG